MLVPKGKTGTLVALGLVALLFSGCGGWWSSANRTRPAPLAVPPAAPLPSDIDQTAFIIRSLEEQVRRRPDDFIAYNKLAGYYLQRQRETGDLAYLGLAGRAARSSLEVLPAEQNRGAFAAQAQAEFAAHDFVAARDHALRLTEIERGKAYPYQILGDALLELGDYERAEEAYDRMKRVERFPSVGTETRLARLALLRGEAAEARERFTRALALEFDAATPQPETIAWCRWQLGETAFAAGDYEGAEQHYRDALTTFPNYYRAVASLGRARAARGDLTGAIEQYEQAVRILPDPSFISALGDLYQLAGRAKDAAAQYALVEKIGRLNELSGAVYNRQLALFYADHDLKPEEAYSSAAREYAVRRDIYGADALAWTALKAGKTDEARAKIEEALHLGTRDARLLYHAGMIARAAGERDAARKYLQRALDMSPQFDALQASFARKALAELTA